MAKNQDLSSSFQEFKEFKNIDRETLMRILEEVFRSALSKRFGSEDNFDIIVNIDKGDLEIFRNRTIVEDGAVQDPTREIALSRAVESQLDRDEEDFALDVSSAGADQPLKLVRQYRKNVGRDLEVVTTDGERAEGTLEDASDEGIVLRTHATKKQPAETLRFAYRDIKAARVAIKF